MNPAISVDSLSKLYRVNHAAPRGGGGYRTLREDLVGLTAGPWRRVRRLFGENGPAPPGETTEDFWALKDLSFDVQPGEVVGIIGRNGAGKSTLLKILSRITPPTSGRITLDGRVGSLLEVGTGFHPELTGRENIYMNGSILGMRRREIQNKFDEIVDFAEIGRFLDTPVKRYSSGMYVRLAFAVAAHLEPEILVIDEVLAVGDADFQKKCLHKMGEVGRSGRTVLFVSHNLSAIRSLCQTGITLERGACVGHGAADEQVAAYFGRLSQFSRQSLDTRTDRDGHGRTRIRAVQMLNREGVAVEQAFSGDEVRLAVSYESDQIGEVPEVALSGISAEGYKLFHVDTRIRGCRLSPLQASGAYVCRIDKLPMVPGIYHLNAQLNVSRELADHIYSAAVVQILPGDFFNSGMATPTFGSLIYLNHEWE